MTVSNKLASLLELGLPKQSLFNRKCQGYQASSGNWAGANLLPSHKRKVVEAPTEPWADYPGSEQDQCNAQILQGGRIPPHLYHDALHVTSG